MKKSIHTYIYSANTSIFPVTFYFVYIFYAANAEQEKQATNKWKTTNKHHQWAFHRFEFQCKNEFSLFATYFFFFILSQIIEFLCHRQSISSEKRCTARGGKKANAKKCHRSKCCWNGKKAKRTNYEQQRSIYATNWGRRSKKRKVKEMKF